MRYLVTVLAVAAATLSCGRGREQALPVAVTVDAESRRLLWSDSEGVLEREVSWVLRTDLLGPDTFLVAETADSGRVCMERVTFRVSPADGIEYRVALVSNLEGAISWTVGYGTRQEVNLAGCTPRGKGEPGECLGGGIPRPLQGFLQGVMEAELPGKSRLIEVGSFRFERSPPEC